jgi:ATP-dependent RNA helicase SUPV3L1/SUV3
MTSLIGASGEDFASILRALGYRMERRPKPAEPPQPTNSAAPQTSETAIPADPPHAPSEDALPVSAQAVAADSGAAEAGMPAESKPAIGQLDASIAEDTASTSAVAAPVNEPEMIEVWRPARMGDQRRVAARQRGRARRGEPAVLPRQPLSESSASGAAASTEPKAGPATAEPAAHSDAHGKPRRPLRQRRPEHRIEREDRQKQERLPGKRFEPREKREKRPDPNSPFAKLAALKAQLEADAKERR